MHTVLLRVTVPFGELCGRRTRPTLGPPERRQRNSWAAPPQYSSHSRWRRAPPSGTDPPGWASRRRSFRRTSCGCTSSGSSMALFWDRPVRQKLDHNESHVFVKELILASNRVLPCNPLYSTLQCLCPRRDTWWQKRRLSGSAFHLKCNLTAIWPPSSPYNLLFSSLGWSASDNSL